MEIRVTHNASISGNVVNGSRGTLKSLRPRDPQSLRDIISNRGNLWNPGEIVTIEQPLAVVLNIPEADVTLREKVTLLVNDNQDIKRREVITLRSSSVGEKYIVTVVSAGYTSTASGTTYAFQGQTLPKCICDLNLYRGMTMKLGHFVVGMTRVRNWLDNRVMPWHRRQDSRNHLLKLRPSDLYLRWEHAYDQDGIFQSSLVREINDIVQEYPPASRVPEQQVRMPRPTRMGGERGQNRSTNSGRNQSGLRGRGRIQGRQSNATRIISPTEEPMQTMTIQNMTDRIKNKRESGLRLIPPPLLLTSSFQLPRKEPYTSDVRTRILKGLPIQGTLHCSKFFVPFLLCSLGLTTIQNVTSGETENFCIILFGLENWNKLVQRMRLVIAECELTYHHIPMRVGDMYINQDFQEMLLSAEQLLYYDQNEIDDFVSKGLGTAGDIFVNLVGLCINKARGES